MTPTSQPEFQPFWDGLREHQIRFPACRACGKVNWYPMKRCIACHGDSFEGKWVCGPGRLWSWTVVRRDFSGGKGPPPPYIVGLIEFDDLPGTRLITNMVDCDEADLAIGAAVEPVFPDPTGPIPTVLFRMVQGAEEQGL